MANNGCNGETGCCETRAYLMAYSYHSEKRRDRVV
jgi:hypothetical protein